MSTARGVRLRPHSELGWTMLQWLAVMVLGHDGKAKRAAMDAEHAATIERVRAKFKPSPGVTDEGDRRELTPEAEAALYVEYDPAVLERFSADLAAVHSLTAKQVEALAASGQVVTETQPPGPELFKVPPEAIVMPGMAPLDKTILRVTREYAEAMGLDPDKLERA